MTLLTLMLLLQQQLLQLQMQMSPGCVLFVDFVDNMDEHFETHV